MSIFVAFIVGGMVGAVIGAGAMAIMQIAAAADHANEASRKN